MLIAVLVIGYVLVLRYLDQKNREKDRQKQGLGVTSGPPDYASIKGAVAELAERLSSLERECERLGARLGGTQ